MTVNANKNIQIDNTSDILPSYLPDSIKNIIEDKKFLLYDYGHHGTKWCLIYENRKSYNILIGTTRSEPPFIYIPIDTVKLLEKYQHLICWGLDSLPNIAKGMTKQYSIGWSTFYSSLRVYNKSYICIFNSNNAIGFEGVNSKKINLQFNQLCYLMRWLSAPELRNALPNIYEFNL